MGIVDGIIGALGGSSGPQTPDQAINDTLSGFALQSMQDILHKFQAQLKDAENDAQQGQ